MVRALPPKDDIVDLVRASLFNARDLLEEARILLESDRAPRAHALATLAFEEIGKANLCVLALVPTENISAREFWSSWRSHEKKLTQAHGLLKMIVTESASSLTKAYAQLDSAASSDHLRKMRGFYVDYSDEGVALPAAVTAGEARQLIDAVQLTLNFLMESWGSGSVVDRITRIDERAEDLRLTLDHLSETYASRPDITVGEVRDVIWSRFGTGEQRK